MYGGGLVAKSCPTLTTPWTVACQAPLSMGFSRQEYWSGLPFPVPYNVYRVEKIGTGCPGMLMIAVGEGLPADRVNSTVDWCTSETDRNCFLKIKSLEMVSRR